ncbi:MAG: hypothetical protein JNK14_11395 [Chitinophagaceae bacterium]|nr:hypothetical protein [Chitinophagaceae bacterium]
MKDVTKYTCVILLLLYYKPAACQPYLDLVNIRYQFASDAGLSASNSSNEFKYVNASLNFPVIFKKDSSMIVLSPFFERWDISGDGLNDIPGSLQSLALPITLIIPASDQWSMGITAIPRWNGYESNVFRKSFQWGAAFLATYKKNSAIKYKFGLYYNAEFSGAFFMPLLGIDWKLSEKSNLFGVLPGHLVYEHRVNKWLYYGASFRSITNTYQAGYINFNLIPKYLRVQDNQLAVFADIYVSKNILLNIEAGHSVARKFRIGIEDEEPKYFFDAKMKAGLLLKASLAYRIRFR